MLAAIRTCPLAAAKQTPWPLQSVTGFASQRTAILTQTPISRGRRLAIHSLRTDTDRLVRCLRLPGKALQASWPFSPMNHIRERSARPSASQKGHSEDSRPGPLPDPAVYENPGGSALRCRLAPPAAGLWCWEARPARARPQACMPHRSGRSRHHHETKSSADFAADCPSCVRAFKARLTRRCAIRWFGSQSSVLPSCEIVNPSRGRLRGRVVGAEHPQLGGEHVPELGLGRGVIPPRGHLQGDAVPGGQRGRVVGAEDPQ